MLRLWNPLQFCMVCCVGPTKVLPVSTIAERWEDVTRPWNIVGCWLNEMVNITICKENNALKTK